MNPSLGSHADAQTCTLSFDREIAAPPEVIFDAWTCPEQVATWWDPSGAPLAECTIDLRPGGQFSFVHAHGFAFTGVYRDVQRPNRLAFEANGAEGVVTLSATGGGTRMHVQLRAQNAAHFENLVRHGVREGTDRTLDNLVAFARR